MNFSFVDYCVCPQCRAELIQIQETLQCTACQKVYEIQDGIPVLLPDYDEQQSRYQQNYEHIAENFLSTNKYAADKVAFRHSALLNFIGPNKRGKKILDIGSSHAAYLNEIEAEFKVAFDIAQIYLKLIPASTCIVPIQGDAEYLPFKAGFFDVIVIADVLEHLLHPERLVNILTSICDTNTQIFVHIPWEENLEPYLNAPFEFSHLRSFNAYTYGALWYNFYIKRSKVTYPDLRYPLIFCLESKLPRFIYNALVWCYFFSPNVSTKDSEWRQQKLNALPQGEWWLLWFFKPVFKMFEMRHRGSETPWWVKLICSSYKRLGGL